MSCRDWTKTLWPASFRGVPFDVETEAPKGGREIETHTFSGGEHWINEDKRRAPDKISISAFVYGDDVEIKAQAVAAAFNMVGAPGLLILPHLGPKMVSVNSCHSTFKRDELGYVSIEIEVTCEPEFAAPPFLVNLSIGVVETAFLAVIPAVTEFLSTTLSLINEADHVVAAAIHEVQMVASVFAEARQALPLAPRDNAIAFQNVKDLMVGAESLVVGLPAIGFHKLSLPEALHKVIGAFVDPLPPRHAFETLVRTLDNFEIYPAPLTLMLSRHRAENAGRVTRIACASLMFADVFYRLVKVEFTNRRDAEQARNAVLMRFDNLIEAVENEQLHHALLAVRDAALEHLSQTTLNLKGLMQLDIKATMPSIYWAHRLYKDVARAEELVMMNDVPHPSFMPQSFEVRVL